MQHCILNTRKLAKAQIADRYSHVPGNFVLINFASHHLFFVNRETNNNGSSNNHQVFRRYENIACHCRLEIDRNCSVIFKSHPMAPRGRENRQRILQECSCIIEFIKRVGEKDKMRGFAEHLIGFPQLV